MSDIILISKVGLYETVKCAICQNPNQTKRGCDGSCKYDKELHAKIIYAVEGIADERPHGKWVYIGISETTGLKIVKCTNCKKRQYGSTDFCSNCGAKMKTWKDGDPE